MQTECSRIRGKKSKVFIKSRRDSMYDEIALSAGRRLVSKKSP